MAKERQCKTRYTASITNGGLYFEDVRQCWLNDALAAEILEDKNLGAIRVVSLSSNWYERVWVDLNTSVRADLKVEMTLRKEKRGDKWHWYAYRRKGGVLQKRYVGQSETINERRIVEIAQSLF